MFLPSFLYLVYVALVFLGAVACCIAQLTRRRGWRPLLVLGLLPVCGLGMLVCLRLLNGVLGSLPALLQWGILMGAPLASLFGAVEISELLWPVRSDPQP